MQLRVQHHAPTPLPQEKTRYPLDTTLVGSRVSLGDSNKTAVSCPAWILNRTVQPAVYSLYRPWYPRSVSPCEGSNNKRNRSDASSSKFSAIHNQSSYFNITLYIGGQLVSAHVLEDTVMWTEHNQRVWTGLLLLVSLLKASTFLSKQSEFC
jgi:hypothetical protein